MKALDYASTFTNVTDQDRQIIIHAKRSLLYHQDSQWKKNNSDNTFDVTMGSYDGAETCELIGLYMLSLITPKFKIKWDSIVMTASQYAKQLQGKSRKQNKKSAMFSNLMVSKSQLKQIKRP